MTDYIKRDDVLADIDELKKSPWFTQGNGHVERAEAIDIVTKLCVQEQPTADVAPIVRGLWYGEGDGYADGNMVYDVWYCSECGFYVDEGDNEPPRWNYCPNCGALMDLTEDNDGTIC